MTERKTEKLVRELFGKNGYNEDQKIIIEEQKSDHPEISRLLKAASKHSTGKKGYPEFLVSTVKFPDFLIVVECKAENAKHESELQDQPIDYAVDGAIHYARHLAKRFNVLAIAASGQSKKDLKISAHLISRGTTDAKPLRNYQGQLVSTIENINELHDYASRDAAVEQTRVINLMSFARDLHNFMRDRARLSEPDKPLLISGILIALQDEAFRHGYKKATGAQLPKKLLNAIKEVVEEADIPEAKKSAMLQPYSFISTHLALTKLIDGTVTTPLQKIVGDIDEHVFPFIAKIGEDIVGRFYGEFLRYTGGDGKGLGIVLTPRHVTDLFCDIAGLTADDVVLDPCCGTGGFLISAMHRMLNLPNVDATKQDHIRTSQLIGIEEQPSMYALAASNMILRGDGKANLFQDSCFEVTVKTRVKELKPTVGFINPPYSQKAAGLHEFDFIENMLECLEKNGRGVAIVPMSCAISPHPSKARILTKHTLEAVMSMPDEIFYPVGTITCLMVFKANQPHDSKKKTWFGYWKDDGFIKSKTDGRVDKASAWENIKRRWIQQFNDRDSKAGECIKASVGPDNEWCAEAYLETDYSTLSLADFESDLRRFVIFNLLNQPSKPRNESGEENK